MTGPLFHFTCAHGYLELGPGGRVVPAAHLPGMFGRMPWTGHLAWFTDLPNPAPLWIGLQSDWIACDRMQHRYRVIEPEDCLPWVDVRGQYNQRDVTVLESHPSAMPDHWFVSGGAVLVALDEVVRV